MAGKELSREEILKVKELVPIQAALAEELAESAKASGKGTAYLTHYQNCQHVKKKRVPMYHGIMKPGLEP